MKQKLAALCAIFALLAVTAQAGSRRRSRNDGGRRSEHRSRGYYGHSRNHIRFGHPEFLPRVRILIGPRYLPGYYDDNYGYLGAVQGLRDIPDQLFAGEDMSICLQHLKVRGWDPVAFSRCPLVGIYPSQSDDADSEAIEPRPKAPVPAEERPDTAPQAKSHNPCPQTWYNREANPYFKLYVRDVGDRAPTLVNFKAPVFVEDGTFNDADHGARCWFEDIREKKGERKAYKCKFHPTSKGDTFDVTLMIGE